MGDLSTAGAGISLIGAGVGGLSALEEEKQAQKRRTEIKGKLGIAENIIGALEPQLLAGLGEGGALRALMSAPGTETAIAERIKSGMAARGMGTRTSIGAQEAERSGELGEVTGTAEAVRAANLRSDLSIANIGLEKMGIGHLFNKASSGKYRDSADFLQEIGGSLQQLPDPKADETYLGSEDDLEAGA